MTTIAITIERNTELYEPYIKPIKKAKRLRATTTYCIAIHIRKRAV